jgi:hypothetical protein
MLDQIFVSEDRSQGTSQGRDTPGLLPSFGDGPKLARFRARPIERLMVSGFVFRHFHEQIRQGGAAGSLHCPDEKWIRHALGLQGGW